MDPPETTPNNPPVSSSSPSTSLNRKPSNWQKVREHILVDEQLPPLPSTPGLSESEGQYGDLPGSPHSEHSSSSTSGYKSIVHFTTDSRRDLGLFRNIPRFKATVLQRTDISKMEKEIDKLMLRRYGGHIFNTSGSTGSVGTDLITRGQGRNKSSLGAQDGGPPGAVGEPLNYLGELHELLKRWKHVVKLAYSQIVLAELAKPFFNYPVNVDDCNQALDIFEFIRDNYHPSDPNENFERIQWICNLLGTRHAAIRSRVYDLAEKLLNATSSNSYFPASVTAIQSLVYTFVHTLIVTSPTTAAPERTQDLIHLHQTVNDFLERLAAGTLISTNPDAMSAGSSPPKDNSLAGCVFLESLVKCLLVKDVPLRKYIMSNLIGKFWIPPDQTMPPLYEHVIQLFAQASFEILADQQSSFVDPANVTESLPYHIITTLNQRLPPENLRSMSPHVVRSLASVVISIFSISFPSSEPQRSPSLSPPMPIENNHQNLHNLEGKNGSYSVGVSVTDLLNLAKTYTETLCKEGWKSEVIQLIREAIEQDSIERCISIYERLVFGLSSEISNEIVKETISALFDKIVKTRPDPLPALKEVLSSLSLFHRPHFYKPMLACVASDSQSKVTEHLHLISILMDYMSGVELFMQDIELMTVIILSDVGETKRASTLSKISWGSTTLGQCAILMEFIWVIRKLRLQRAKRAEDKKLDEIAKSFLTKLESRLAIFIAAKEKTKFIPMPLRVLLSDLFLEIRIYCKNTSRPGWVSRMIDWLINSKPGTMIYRDPVVDHDETATNKNPFATLAEIQMDVNQLDDVEMIFQRIRVVYATLDDRESVDLDGDEMLDAPVPVITKTIPETSFTPKTLGLSMTSYNEMKRHSTVIASAIVSYIGRDPSSSINISKQRLHRFNDFTEDIAEAILGLLVAVFPTLSIDEYTRLSPYIWDRYLNDREQNTFASASFLFIQCGEKASEMIKGIITRDLYSTNALIRAMTLRKISSLFGYRHQFFCHPYISTASRRRLFRSKPSAIPFVPTDLGTADLILYNSIQGLKMKYAASLTADVRRRIQELGWEEEDEVEQERIKRITTPLSVLPTFYLDDEEIRIVQENAAMHQTTKIAKMKANVTPIQPTFNKRRTVNIPVISLISPNLVALLDDAHGGVYNLTKELLTYLLKDDPALFLRLFLTDLGSSGLQAQKELLTQLRFLASMQYTLPPGFTYTLFNHLAGMLKWSSRENKGNGLSLMTSVLPLLSELVPKINGMTIRDIRKNKVENFLSDNGQFWFTEGLPISMFPRQMTDHRKNFVILDIPAEIFEVTMLRIGHIHFMNNFLNKSPKEVYSLKKIIQTFEPTPLSDGHTNSTQDEERYLPDIEKQKGHLYDEKTLSRHEKDIRLIGGLRARMWLNFLLTLLNGLNRNYNDRAELNQFLSGANTILLDHSDDFGIVGQALVLYISAATGFRRLFDTHRGYTIFLPALFKVFCESENKLPIRLAIMHAWSQFFAAHGESFVFQTIGCLSPLILKAYTKSSALGECMSASLFTLFKSLNFPEKLADPLGIHDAFIEEEPVEYGVLDPVILINNVNTALHKINTVNTIRRVASLPKQPFSIGLPEETKLFALDDLLRLFLTIIAYDPGSLRAEQMVQLLRLLLPHLLQESSSVSSLVADGVDALTEVFFKFGRNVKPQLIPVPTKGTEDADILDISQNSKFTEAATTQAYGKQWQQNDRISIKRQFLLLVQTYKRNGGLLSDNTHNKLGNIIKLMIKDYSSAKMRTTTSFLKDYIIDVLLHDTTFEEGRRPIFTFLRNIALLFRQHYKIIDFSELIEGIVLIVTDKCEFVRNDNGIGSMIKEKFLSFGLSIALRPDWEEGEHFQWRFCQSLVKLLVAMMTHSEQDIFDELDKIPPSHQLIAHIILPICLHLNLEENYFTPITSSLSTDNRGSHKAINYWMRLLAYVTKACSRDFILRSKSTFNFLGSSQTDLGAEPDQQTPESNRHSKAAPSNKHAAATLIISFTALKVLLIRGEKYLTTVPGIWIYIAQLVRKTFASAGQTKTGIYSHGSSPPGSNTNVAIIHDGRYESPERSVRPVSSQNNPKPSISPSALDFALWSFLEFLVFYKNPLNLYLKTFIHQKLNNAPSMRARYLSRNSSFDGLQRSPSPMSAGSDSGKARWKSWGGPPAGFRNSLTPVSGGNIKETGNKFDTLQTPEQQGILQTSSLSSNRDTISRPHAGTHTGQFAPNLLDSTLRSLSNVHTYLGGGNVSNTNNNDLNTNPHQSYEQYTWSYIQAIQKMQEERRLVMESFPSVFKLASSNLYTSNNAGEMDQH